MAAPNVVRSAVGLRYVTIFALNANGTPNATGTTAYEGVRISAAKTLELTVPEARQIVHFGDDRVLALDILPPTEPASGVLTVGRINDTIDAILTENLSFTGGDGETKLQLMATDNQGDEPQVGILAFQQAIDTTEGSATYGKRYWESYLLPKAWVTPMAPSMTDAPAEVRYNVRPQIVGAHLWGTAFVLGTEGAVQAQLIRGVSEFHPKIISFLGNGTATTFTLPASFPAQAATKVAVWVNGTLQTSGITKNTNNIVFTAAPANNARIDVLYEYA
jgi:hypothetical protein